MVDDSAGTTMYATKRRRRSVKAVKPPMKDPPKSNPSKRHRERLNGELDHLASLLPFEQSVISKLDKLSILRLAVSYLRTKTYFQAALHERYALEGHHHLVSHNPHHLFSEPSFTDTDSVLQALSGFLFVVACDGEVFFASRTVEQYLGFHQSDIIHQSALELIHSEDREDFKNQLNWRSQLATDQADMSLQQVMMPENSDALQRCFTVRFRCLLDNTSGFITLELSGRIKVLHGQSLKGEEPPLALFAICCPFGPLPLLDVPPRDYTFKSKHKMDMAPLSMDPRGKLLFGYSDRELMDKGGYDLLHPDDLSYYAAAHQELIKTGSSGLIAYRLQSKDFRWIWLQTSSKVVYKNSKPDFVICTHRHLTEDEGRDLVGKRGSEFKLPYPIIDTDPTGLGASFEEEDVSKLKSQRNKKSKTQLRDYLQAARKRKTPYREVYTGLNGYTPYTGINGYSACQAGEMKTEFMYPYAGNNFALDADIYRTGYPFTGSVYPGTDGFRLDTDKHGYTNGYYLEPRQYQHTLQYHGNGYTDLGSKYSYDMSKYGYDMSSYGLDLTKRGQYETDLSRYETDLRKYDYSVDKISRVNGTYDSLRSSSLYGTNPMINNEALLSCNVSQNTGSTSCSLYRSDNGSSSTNLSDRYSQNSLMSKDVSKYGASTTSSVIDSSSSECKPNLVTTHTSVIRNPTSQKTKTPSADPSAVSSALYTPESATNSVLANCGSATWHAPCSKAMDSQYKEASLHSASSNASQSPMESLTTNDVSSHIVSPHSKPVQDNSTLSVNNSSPALASTATSVIQMSGRPRSTCDKQSPVTGGIAVPVVKSSAWLHHIPSTPSYDWHLPVGSTDSYSCHQRALRNSTDSSYYNSVEPSVAAAHTRAIVEAPKYASVRHGEKLNPESNPLLTFSEVTHTLLSNG